MENHTYKHKKLGIIAEYLREGLYRIKAKNDGIWDVPTYIIQDSLDREIIEPVRLDNIINSLFFNGSIIDDISESEVRLIIKEHILPLLSKNND